MKRQGRNEIVCRQKDIKTSKQRCGKNGNTKIRLRGKGKKTKQKGYKKVKAVKP